jgi:hypothetical protein
MSLGLSTTVFSTILGDPAWKWSQHKGKMKMGSWGYWSRLLDPAISETFWQSHIHKIISLLVWAGLKWLVVNWKKKRLSGYCDIYLQSQHLGGFQRQDDHKFEASLGIMWDLISEKKKKALTNIYCFEITLCLLISTYWVSHMYHEPCWALSDAASWQ